MRVSWLTSMRGACAAVRRLTDLSVAKLPGGTSLRWSTPSIAPTANDLRQELELTRFQVDRGSYATSSAPPSPTRPYSLQPPPPSPVPRMRMASSSRQCSFDCTQVQVRDLRQAPRPCRCASWRAGSMVLREDAYLRILRRHLVENSSSSYRTPAQFPRAIRQRDLGGLDRSRFCDIAFLKALPRKEREKWRICGSRTRTKPKRGNVNG